jgi:hypothetical protein
LTRWPTRRIISTPASKALEYTMIYATPRLRRTMLTSLSAALLAVAVAFPAVAGAKPPPQQHCPKNTVTIGSQGQIVSPPARNQVCDDDQTGLLGSLPVLGGLF